MLSATGFLARIVLLVLSMSALEALNADDQRRPMTPVDILNLPAISNPVISPDKSSVLFVKSEANWDENRKIGNLWVVKLRDNKPRQLTFDHETRSLVKWSPDGSYISYISNVADSKMENDGFKGIHLLPMDGGLAFQPGIHAADIKNYVWAPDGQSIYFIADEPESKHVRKRRKSKDDMVAFEQPDSYRRIWSMSLADGVVRKLSDDDRHVLGFTLSVDGKIIAYNSARSRTIDSWHSSDIWLMDNTGGNSRRLTLNNFAERKIEISPDNQQILFISDINKEGEYYHDANLFLISIESGEISLLAEEQTFEVEDAEWSKNGESIYIRANMGVHSELWSISRDDSKPRKQLTDGIHTVTNWNYDRTTDAHVFVLVKPDSPGEIYYLDGKGAAITPLTEAHSTLGERFLLPRQELIQFQANDGTELEGILSYPLDFKPGTSYPLIINAHGGPKSSDQYGQFRWRTYIPVLAAHGYMYFSPNYRGGRGYGDEFLREMVGGIFNNAHLDILAGLDHLISKNLVDPDRLAMSGWSAGGHMTNKLITFTDRFKAASSGAGAVEWVSMFGESDVRYSRKQLFGGTPWQQNAPLDVYYSNSVLTDMWKVKTPTIIFVGEKDKRVPTSQSMMMYRALRDLGVETELYIAPREPHSFRELRHRLFKINVELAWFEKHVNNSDYEWQTVPESTTDNEP